MQRIKKNGDGVGQKPGFIAQILEQSSGNPGFVTKNFTAV